MSTYSWESFSRVCSDVYGAGVFVGYCAGLVQGAGIVILFIKNCPFLLQGSANEDLPSSRCKSIHVLSLLFCSVWGIFLRDCCSL